MLRMIRQPGVENFLHFGMTFQEACDRVTIDLVLDHADGERLYAAQHQPALEGRHDGSGSFLHESKFFRMLRLGGNEDAAESVAVSVEEFGRRVQDDVR